MNYDKDSTSSSRKNDPFYSSNDGGGSSVSFGIDSVVRLIGALVMLAGLVIGFQVVGRAWELFDDSKSIATLAEELELRSNLNSFVQSYGALMLKQLDNANSRNNEVARHNRRIAEQSGEEAPAEAITPPSMKEQMELARSLKELNLVYFIAWGLGLMLLYLIGRIAFWAMLEGAKVAILRDGKQTSFPRRAK